MIEWWSLPTALTATSPDVPEGLRWSLLVMALGVFLSGVRDLVAALGVPHGGWPWEKPGPGQKAQR